MILYQAWSESSESWGDCWDDGHYSVVIGVDDENVYLEDPSLAGEIGFIPRPEFLTRWHDVDREGNELERFGIAVMGGTPTQELQYRKID